MKFTRDQLNKIKEIRDDVFFEDPDADMDVYLDRINDIDEFASVTADDIREIIFSKEGVTDDEVLQEFEEDKVPIKSNMKVSESVYGRAVDEFDKIDGEITDKYDAQFDVVFNEDMSDPSVIETQMKLSDRIQRGLSNIFTNDHIIPIEINDHGKRKIVLYESTVAARDVLALATNIKVKSTVKPWYWPDGSIAFVGIATAIDLNTNTMIQVETMKFYRKLVDPDAEEFDERFIFNDRAFELCQSTARRKAILQLFPREMIMRAYRTFIDKQRKAKK